MGNTTLEREILPLLVTCALVYQTNQTPEELSILADIFAEDLEKENLESITNAFALYRRRSTRFPTPAHIIAILPECRVLPKLKALPQTTTCRKTKGAGRLAFEALKGNKDSEMALKRLTGRVCKEATA